VVVMAANESEMLKLYTEEAGALIEDLKKNLLKLRGTANDFGTIREMLEQCHHLEGTSLQANQYLMAYLSSKINSLLVSMPKASPSERKESLVFLSDFINDLKRTLNYISRKKECRAKVELFERINKLIREKYLKEGEYV
jgi:chemotaxis protein histidine kinase CheA